MPPFMTGSRILLSLPVAAALLVAHSAPVRAQSLPSPQQQEVLIKASLMSFNDANVTNNYTVFHAKMSKPFRDQFSPERMQTIFKSFVEKKIDFDLVVAKAPIPDKPAAIDGEGTLSIVGHFDTTPSQVTYNLDFIRSDGEWKLSGINVKLGDGNKPPEPVATPAPAPAPVAPAEKSSSGKIQIK